MTELLLNFDMTTTCNIHSIGHFVVSILLNKHIIDVKEHPLLHSTEPSK